MLDMFRNHSINDHCSDVFRAGILEKQPLNLQQNAAKTPFQTV
jgi:hypothetical protein